MRFVDLKAYNYILTNAAVKFGDFHALMQALQGVASSDPDSYLKTLKKDVKALKLESQAEWPVFWASLQEYKAEMQALKDDGGLKNINPMTDHETLELVLDHVRKVFPRINTLHLNTKAPPKNWPYRGQCL